MGSELVTFFKGIAGDARLKLPIGRQVIKASNDLIKLAGDEIDRLEDILVDVNEPGAEFFASELTRGAFEVRARLEMDFLGSREFVNVTEDRTRFLLEGTCFHALKAALSRGEITHAELKDLHDFYVLSAYMLSEKIRKEDDLEFIKAASQRLTNCITSAALLNNLLTTVPDPGSTTTTKLDL